MFLTIDRRDGGETFDDCFDYLMDTLPNHNLLTQTERDTCRSAIEKLKGVFGRFHRKGYDPYGDRR